MTANFALRVAGAQIPVGTDIKANTANLLRAIDIAVGKGADILLTPEGSLSGYTHEFDTAAAGKNLGLALGTCYFEGDGRCYNQVRFYTRDGAYLGFHSKTLTCGRLTDPPRGEIERYVVAPLRVYNWPDVRLGGLICNDLWANPGCTPHPTPTSRSSSPAWALASYSTPSMAVAVATSGRRSAFSTTKPICACGPAPASCGSSPPTIALPTTGAAPRLPA